jgi:hypothetical protein
MSLSMRDTVHKSIGASNRNTALLSIVAIAIAVAAFGLSTSKYILAHFGETRVMTADEVKALTAEQLPIYNVQVTGSLSQDSGYEEYETENGSRTKTTAYFAYLGLGEDENDFKVMIVRNPTVIDEDITTYKGALEMPTSISKEVYDDILVDDPESKDLLMPWILDTVDQSMPWFMGAGAEAVLLLGGLFGLATVAGRRNPENHPIIKRMARFGDAESVMSQIDNEMSMGEPAQVDKLQFTRSWTIYKAGNDMHFMRTPDVVWAYKHITQTRYGKNYAAYIWDRTGQMLNIGSSEKNVDAMIVAVLQRAPWAIAGYNRDVEKSWKNDRDGFIRTVDDRRKQMTTQQ